MTERAEEYQELKRLERYARRWHSVTLFAGIACLISAGTNGIAEGWLWCIAGIFALWINLWALIDKRHYEQLIAILLK